MFFLGLKKVPVVKITPRQIPITREKKFSPSKIFHLTLLGRSPPSAYSVRAAFSKCKINTRNTSDRNKFRNISKKDYFVIIISWVNPCKRDIEKMSKHTLKILRCLHRKIF